jgi:uncharacterized protein (DUF2344 family)
MAAKQDEIEKEQRRKDLLERELKVIDVIFISHPNQELKSSLDQRQQEIKNKQQSISQGHEKIQRLELQLKEQRSLTEKAQKDWETLNQRTQKLQKDLEEQISVNTQLLAENSQRHVELREKEEHITELEQKETNANKY